MKVIHLFAGAMLFAGLPALVAGALAWSLFGSQVAGFIVLLGTLGFGLSMLRPRPERGEHWTPKEDDK